MACALAGEYGNVRIETQIVRSENLAGCDPTFGAQARTATPGTVVEMVPAGMPDAPMNAPLRLADLRVVQIDPVTGKQTFLDQSGATRPPATTDRVHICTLQVVVTGEDGRGDTYDRLAADPRQERYIGKVLLLEAPEDSSAVVWLDYNPGGSADPVPAFLPAKLMAALRGAAGPGQTVQLTGGRDGAEVSPVGLQGFPADRASNRPATGLAALAEIEEIGIVAVPDASAYADDRQQVEAAAYLLRHAEQLKYCIAVLDAGRGGSINAVREFRPHFNSAYGALYYPWVEVPDPTAARGAPRLLQLPPSGFVAGIYARTDNTQGVHKAPANAMVQGVTSLTANTTDAQQAVLSREGINVLRAVPGRGILVWGVRTLSADPDWKYVNVRRLFLFLEHSIEVGTQWAVFEPNGPQLWATIQRAITDFLTRDWQGGMLPGSKPEQAFFVRCDRTTMTQADIDAGRLICLIGVAPIKPAEFVIFRISRLTAPATP